MGHIRFGNLEGERVNMFPRSYDLRAYKSGEDSRISTASTVQVQYWIQSTEDHATEPTVSTPFLQNDLLKTKISLLVAVENRTLAILIRPHDLSLALDLNPKTLHFGYFGNFHGDPSGECVASGEGASAVHCVVVQLELFDCHGDQDQTSCF